MLGCFFYVFAVYTVMTEATDRTGDDLSNSNDRKGRCVIR